MLVCIIQNLNVNIILIFKEGQRLPIHYHAMKTEDIINRGGGTMEMRFYLRKEDGTVDYESDVEYCSDGIKCVLKILIFFTSLSSFFGIYCYK